jgi:hypothetical protein
MFVTMALTLLDYKWKGGAMGIVIGIVFCLIYWFIGSLFLIYYCDYLYKKYQSPAQKKLHKSKYLFMQFRSSFWWVSIICVIVAAYIYFCRYGIWGGIISFAAFYYLFATAWGNALKHLPDRHDDMGIKRSQAQLILNCLVCLILMAGCLWGVLSWGGI